MPIRMVEDNPRNQNNNNRGGGGGGINLGCLMMFLPYLLRRPKLLFPLLILFGLGYFFVLPHLSPETAEALFSTGGLMKQEVYDKAEVFEPLDLSSKNPLPESVSLEKYCPQRLNQGSQGSCVAWSSAYAARTIQEAMAQNIDPNSTRFSPAYLYNQIALENCQGAYIQNAMELMQNQGLATLDEFPYNDRDCQTTPDETLISKAGKYKTLGYNRLTKSGDNYNIDFYAIKQNLAQGAPVVIGMMVGNSFMQPMLGKDLWTPDEEDYDLRGMGGHAMCVIGYDDIKYGGAFQIMNSWGEAWGNKGIAWVNYKDFMYFTKEAYGLYPMGAAEDDNKNLLDVSFGLLQNETKKYIALEKEGKNLFRTKNPITKGTKFKVEIENKAACYVYIFGEETDNSNYVLFPYTPKHSPYCGITGSRIFPRDYSMMADEIGNQDEIAVLISKKPLDYKSMNETMNQERNIAFSDRLFKSVQAEIVDDVTFSNNEMVSFKTILDGKNIVTAIIKINKK